MVAPLIDCTKKHGTTFIVTDIKTSEIYQRLTVQYGNNSMGRKKGVFMGKRIQIGKEGVINDAHSGQSSI
jgi:hypothetical protein